jgi:exopolyphosphatase/guanosine-5'-triphosphate,3'-diphosphate pyrophosphatase
MPGFSQAEQSRLARLVLAHRGKLSKIESLPARSVDWMQIVSIRLAALLCKTRTAETLPVPHLRQTEDGFTLALDRNWLDGHPLTEAVLEAEIDEWRGLGMDLLLVDRLPGTR